MTNWRPQHLRSSENGQLHQAPSNTYVCTPLPLHLYLKFGPAVHPIKHNSSDPHHSQGLEVQYTRLCNGSPPQAWPLNSPVEPCIQLRLTFMYRMVKGLVPTMPADTSPEARSLDQINNPVENNIQNNNRSYSDRSYTVPHCYAKQYTLFSQELS